MDRGLTWLAAALSVALPAVALAEGGDPDAGATVFRKCAVCHSVTDQTRKIGPTLNGVIGRRAGTLPDYKYSGFMVLAGEGGLVWNEAEIGIYVVNPKGKIPGTSMAFAGLKKADDVANVVAYIKQFSPN